MESEKDYEAREQHAFHAQLDDVEKATLSDRREAREEWMTAMADTPDIVAQRIDWLIDGNYGYGPYQAARKMLANRRMNRVAWFAQTIAALEWGCPQAFARSAWNALPPDKRDRVNQAIDNTLREAEKAIKAEQAGT